MKQHIHHKPVKPKSIHLLIPLAALLLFAPPSPAQDTQDTQPAQKAEKAKKAKDPQVAKNTQDSKDLKEITPPAADNTGKPPPLPLHQIEGNGGIFSTLSAYIVNPPRNGEPVGRPATGFAYIDLGHQMNLEALTITESPYKRIEIGYGWNRLGLGDLPQVLGISTHEVQVHNANLRFQLLEENEFGQNWLPAVTFGVHYKYNDGIATVNKELGGALYSLTGIKKDNGTDFTLYASKLIKGLPRPVLLEAGGRATEAVWDGLGGFTNKYNFVFEGNVVVFLTDNFALAGEYKQQPTDYNAIGNVFKVESDWWTLDAAYVVNKNLTLAGGYGHFGNVLNHEANGVWGITTKWEF
ncbi:MAG: DUF3034 family protein [Methylacidiphilales bacterium]|nr:DUF3034 family protein [Candidatus Methylacidiphilales bacterium]